MKVQSDVAVIGSGPAGLALAASCAELGLDVVCVAPSPWRVWAQNYGIWSHEESLVSEAAVAARYAKPRVWLRDDAGLTLPRGYLRLSSFRLHGDLMGRADATGVRMVDAHVSALEHDARGARLTTREGVVVEADGVHYVVEYSDLPAALAAERLPDGALKFHAGSIAVHACAAERRDDANARLA
jgi:lycopene beta-cyclase